MFNLAKKNLINGLGAIVWPSCLGEHEQANFGRFLRGLVDG